MSIALHILQASDFQPHLNQNFIIHFSKDSINQARLIHVTELNGYSELERKPFSITLQTKINNYYPQAIYSIEHPQHGIMDVFLVPIGVAGNEMQYEAVFS
jgi:hypothetical protein